MLLCGFVLLFLSLVLLFLSLVLVLLFVSLVLVLLFVSLVLVVVILLPPLLSLSLRCARSVNE